MDFGMEAGIFLIYTAGLAAIYFFGKILLQPFKRLMKLLINGAIGGVALVVLNYVGIFVGISIPINILTALIAGVLGLPGIAVLTAYFCFVP